MLKSRVACGCESDSRYGRQRVNIPTSPLLRTCSSLFMKSLQLGKGHFHRGRQIIGLFSSRTVPSCDQKSAFSYNNNSNSGPFSGWGVTVQFYSRRTSQVLETTKDPAWSVLFDLLTDPEPYLLCLALDSAILLPQSSQEPSNQRPFL